MKDIKFEREINPTVVAQDELYEGKVKPLYITEEIEEIEEIEEEKPLD